MTVAIKNYYWCIWQIMVLTVIKVMSVVRINFLFYQKILYCQI